MRRVNVQHVQSMVENGGGLETVRVQLEKHSKGRVEKKAYLFVWELKRYSTFVAAISETKWFGDNMYEVEHHVILHSGRRLPGEGETVKRGEGLGIVLSQVVTKAWRESGEEYEAIGYRIITTRLKISGY